MDFAALMSQQISKATAKTSPPPQASSPSPTPEPAATSTSANSTKYISRRELEEARRRAYLEEQRAIEAERAAKAAAKRKREEEAAQEAKAREEKRRRLAEESRRRREEKEAEEERARRRRLGLPELPPRSVSPGTSKEGTPADDDGEDVPDDELVVKLREMGEPAILFGESHAARLRRFRKLTGQMVVYNAGPIPTTLAPVEEKDMKVSGTVPKPEDKAERKWLYRQLASYFNMVLREWEIALAKEGNRDTFAGKAAYNAMVSSKETMKPLFRKFEKGTLDESILEAIVEIVKAAQERRYVDANDGYLRLSIGKAAWPIGVTMVGIHERSAREKLHNGERGHVMGDEVTRKFLQSIKRCLSFAQVRWPPEDLRQLMG
ncbi:hypothetical protein VTK73DRAFT_9811 [Phialemonium thermophilum]|uniref:Pre-mRNA-splicing factor 18 n=1 Tax=Phialemonium thermophilum TaxID=223376 RepID=A0ABR3XJ14_9PEZI